MFGTPATNPFWGIPMTVKPSAVTESADPPRTADVDPRLALPDTRDGRVPSHVKYL